MKELELEYQSSQKFPSNRSFVKNKDVGDKSERGKVNGPAENDSFIKNKKNVGFDNSRRQIELQKDSDGQSKFERRSDEVESIRQSRLGYSKSIGKREVLEDEEPPVVDPQDKDKSLEERMKSPNVGTRVAAYVEVDNFAELKPDFFDGLDAHKFVQLCFEYYPS